VQRQSKLLQVIAALGSPGSLTRLLDGRQQQSDQDRDDRDHDQQLNQRERPLPGSDFPPRRS
jgi:hypothetical protein